MPDPSNPAIISISLWMLIPVLFCYIVFRFIANKYEDLVTVSMLNLTNLQLTKVCLFILIFTLVPLFILFVYRIVFEGDTDHYKSVYGIISVCFFSIMFTTFVLLELAPYLVDIFENTLGYLFLFIPYLNWHNKIQKFSEMFKQAPVAGAGAGAPPVAVLTDTNNSYAFLITTISLLNMKAAVESLNDLTAGIQLRPTIVKNGDNYKIIKDLVLLKHSVGHFVWIYFATLICTFTSIKAFAKYLPT